MTKYTFLKMVRRALSVPLIIVRKFLQSLKNGRTAIARRAWMLAYAGRVMEIERVPFNTGWRKAQEAAYLYPDFENYDYKTLADARMKMYRRD